MGDRPPGQFNPVVAIRFAHEVVAMRLNDVRRTAGNDRYVRIA